MRKPRRHFTLAWLALLFLMLGTLVIAVAAVTNLSASARASWDQEGTSRDKPTKIKELVGFRGPGGEGNIGSHVHGLGDGLVVRLGGDSLGGDGLDSVMGSG